MTVINASQKPRIFYCRHMQPGIARYEKETILVDSDGMKNLIASATKQSIPVYINHIDGDVDLKNIKAQAAGYVSDSFYNDLDGWAWFKFIAIDDQAHEAIKKGLSVSNAYIPTEWGPSGTKNNCPYNREVRNGEFTHLAIVPDPRYEGACIYTPDEYKKYQDDARKKLAELKNSKGTKSMFKHVAKMFKTTREEVTDATQANEFELKNGKTYTLEQMINALEEKPEEKTYLVNGKKMTADEIAAEFEKKNGKGKPKKNGESHQDTPDSDKGEDTEGDQEEEGDDQIGDDKKNKAKKNKKMKKNADDEDDDMENSDDDCDDKKDEKKNKMKKNDKTTEVELDDKFFNSMRTAHLNPRNADRDVPMVVTSIDGIARGKSRYGSGK